MSRNIYITSDNAEQVIQDAIEILIDSERKDARSRAFDDCTNYWRKEVKAILNSSSPNGAKVQQIRNLFSILYDEE